MTMEVGDWKESLLEESSIVQDPGSPSHGGSMRADRQSRALISTGRCVDGDV
ncbi:hypothetical protein E2C01_088395 [Portunus trituberculatus]|uniref:Uncharacterized protein n=1 Tax=Portunus trituberculatus TaxID=210409 RepID=A0A5B7J625_PORTR|nr:hypothetical protein [Portunus trituberculatus]